VTDARPAPVGPALGVLVDDAADRELARTGYVVVPFLPADEVERLRGAAVATGRDDDEGLVIGFADPDRTVMRATEAALEAMWTAHLPDLFTGHRIVVSTFITKHPGDASAMAMHREPTFVLGDVRTFNAWIPLVDVSKEQANGVLWLVPGSEDLPQGLVGFNTPPLFRAYEDDLRAAGVGIDVPAGSAVVYDTRMLHWSDANHGVVARPAIAAAVAPQDEPLVHVVATGRRGRRLHRVDPSFFVEHHPNDVAAGLGARWPDVGGADEAPVLRSDDVAAAVALPAAPRRRTVLPGDLVDAPTGREESTPVAVPGAVAAANDVALDLPARTDGPAGWEVEVCGHAAIGPLDEVAASVPDGVAVGLRSLAATGGPHQHAVAWLEPGSRLVVRPGGGYPLHVATLDAPELRAGLAWSHGVGTLDPGTAHVIDGGHAVTCWNDGPGQAWIVLSAPDAPGRTTGDAPTSGEAPPPAGTPALADERPVRGRRRWFRR